MMGYSEQLRKRMNDRPFMNRYETATGLRRSSLFEEEGDLNVGIALVDEGVSEHDFRMTPFETRVKSKEAFPLLFKGNPSKTGKAAERFCRELAAADCGRIIVVTDDRRFRNLILNGKDFGFYSMGNAERLPINMNPCRIPDGIDPQRWIDMLVSVWCRAYGVLERGKRTLADVLYGLYEQAGCFDADPGNGEIGRKSESVTMHKAYKTLETLRILRGSREDGFSAILERLSCFSRPYSSEYRLFSAETDFCDPNAVGTGSGIDALMRKRRTLVLETVGMEETFRRFVAGFIAHATNMICDADDSSAKPTFLFTDEDELLPSRWSRNIRPAVSSVKDDAPTEGYAAVASASGKGFRLPEAVFMLETASERPRYFTPADCGPEDFLLSEEDLHEKIVYGQALKEEGWNEARSDKEETPSAGSDLFRKIAEDAKMRLAVIDKETRSLCVKILLKTSAYGKKEALWANMPSSELIRTAKENMDDYVRENVRILEKMLANNAEKDERIRELCDETERLKKELRREENVDSPATESDAANRNAFEKP